MFIIILLENNEGKKKLTVFYSAYSTFTEKKSIVALEKGKKGFTGKYN